MDRIVAFLNKPLFVAVVVGLFLLGVIRKFAGR